MASYLPPKHILNTFNPTEFETSLSSEDVETKLNVLENTKQNLIDSSNRLNANLINDGSVSNTEFNFLDGVTSSIQTQLNAKQATIDSSNRLDPVLIGDGFVELSEFNRLNGVSSDIQSQLNGKQATIDSSNRLNANLIHDGSVSNTEFSRLNGLSGNIQTQLNGKQDDINILSNNGDYNVTLSRSDGDTVALDVQGRIEINPRTQGGISGSTETEGFVTNVASTFNANTSFTGNTNSFNGLTTTALSSFNANTEFNNNVFIKSNADLFITSGRQLLLTDATLQLNGTSKLKVSDTSSSNSELEIFHDTNSNDSIIRENASSDLKLETNGDHIEMRVTDSQDLMFRASKNGKNELYYSGVKRLETRVDGINIINDLIAGNDGEIKISNISTGFGSETVSIQSYIDNGASGNNPDPFNISDNRYTLALQPSHGRLTIGCETALGNAKVSINEQTGNTSANPLMCIGGGDTGHNGAIQITCINNGNDKKQDGMAIKAVSNTNHIINFINTAGQERGKIKGTSASSVSYDTTSDRRLKTNIENMDSQIDNIMNLRPVKYNWISDNEFDEGLIAQEVHKIYPSFIEKYNETYCTDNENYDTDCPCDASGKEYYYGLDYSKFTPYIIKCIQELKTMYDDKIQKLEERLNTLENNE